MALRTLMKRKELNDANKALTEARAKVEAMQKREAELEQAIAEAETDEERAAVEESVTEFEQEAKDAEAAVKSLEERVAGIEAELADLERAQEPAPQPETAPETKPEQRTERNYRAMNRRSIINRMDAQTRTAMFEREDVKYFLGEVRSALIEKRAITNGSLLVPEVFLGLIRQNIEEYSKLYKHVNVRQVSGDGRFVIEGTIPEAVWTDCCANVNEIGITFNDAEVACWNVGAYLPVCRATLEDSDIDLAAEVITVLGAAIGMALDKAIIFGTGTRMPLGIVTRLQQTVAPAGYSTTARPWVNLSATNIAGAPSGTGVAYFQALLQDFAAADGKYSRGEKVFVMNEATYTQLKIQGLSVNAAGAIVSAIDGAMPVIGGVIEVLDFMPSGMIVGGYFDLYLLAERSGMKIEESDHVMFLNRKRVYMANARYDGLPVIPEAFAAIIPNGTSNPDFAEDAANQGN